LQLVSLQKALQKVCEPQHRVQVKQFQLTIMAIAADAIEWAEEMAKSDGFVFKCGHNGKLDICHRDAAIA